MATIQLPKAPVAMDWVTVANIGATGTGIVSSAPIVLPLSTVPDIVDLIVEIEMTLQRTGGSGACNAWVLSPGANIAPVSVADNNAGSVQYTSHISASSVATTRKIRLRPSIIHSPNSNYTVVAEMLLFSIRAVGTAADTVWTATGIKGRLIYTPL